MKSRAAAILRDDTAWGRTDQFTVAKQLDGLQEKFRNNPHAWMKLWKSRSAQKEAVRATQVARERDEEFLHWVGENISAEWLIPKALETFHDAPEVFEAAEHIMDLPDYMTMRLTGRYTTNIGTLCFKQLGMHE